MADSPSASSGRSLSRTVPGSTCLKLFYISLWKGYVLRGRDTLSAQEWAEIASPRGHPREHSPQNAMASFSSWEYGAILLQGTGATRPSLLHLSSTDIGGSSMGGVVGHPLHCSNPGLSLRPVWNQRIKLVPHRTWMSLATPTNARYQLHVQGC